MFANIHNDIAIEIVAKENFMLVYVAWGNKPKWTLLQMNNSHAVVVSGNQVRGRNGIY